MVQKHAPVVNRFEREAVVMVVMVATVVMVSSSNCVEEREWTENIIMLIRSGHIAHRWKALVAKRISKKR